MNENATLAAVLLGITLVFSGLVLAMPSYQMFASAETNKGLARPVENMDAFAAFTCPPKNGTCSPPGIKACDEDLGAPPQLHACEYTCTTAGTWGPGRECGTNMCSGAQCNQDIRLGIYNIAT